MCPLAMKKKNFTHKSQFIFILQIRFYFKSIKDGDEEEKRKEKKRFELSFFKMSYLQNSFLAIAVFFFLYFFFVFFLFTCKFHKFQCNAHFVESSLRFFRDWILIQYLTRDPDTFEKKNKIRLSVHTNEFFFRSYVCLTITVMHYEEEEEREHVPVFEL